MFVYRVFPHDPNAGLGEPGHPLYVHPDQGAGRWDNPDLYSAMYVASTAEGAIGETFAHLSHWKRAMLEFPAVPDATRRLGAYELDEEATPLLDLDDAKALVDRALRPSEVVVRNRPHTQGIARGIFGEQKWAGISWWSMHRPQWSVHVLFGTTAVTYRGIEDLPGHPALLQAGARLAKQLDLDIRT